MDDNQICRFLPWDSNFFRYRIARVNPTRLSDENIDMILQWCQKNQIECLYFLADSDHPKTVQLAENHGFRFVDIRTTLHMTIKELSSVRTKTAIIRNYYPPDLPELIDIARISFTQSRFYADPRFSLEASDLLYETWVENEVSANPDGIFVAERDGQIAGFITCQISIERDMGIIGLIGVSASSRRMGIGQSLIDQTVRWVHEHGAKQIIVVTQGGNIPALRLYEQAGFLTQQLQLWYHKWFDQ